MSFFFKRFFFENTAPLGLVSLRECVSFIRISFRDGFSKVIKNDNYTGVVFCYNFFAIEYYTGDIEPKIEPFKGLRFIIWDRIRNNQKIKHWFNLNIGGKLASNAIIDLSSENYFSDWAHSTKSYYNKWFTQDEYEVLETNLQTFLKDFKIYARPKKLTNVCVENLMKKEILYKDIVTFYILKNKKTGIVCAGACTFDFPEFDQSYYMYSFYAREYIPKQAGVWLLNYWFMQCRKKEIKYANLGTVYEPGQPKSWKGFSNFKMYFKPLIFTYQPPLFRFTFSLKGEKEQE